MLLRRLAAVPRDILEQASPEWGAMVMGSGIVAVDLATAGQAVLANAVLAIAAVAWTVLVLAVAVRLVHDRQRLLTESHRPGALTAVAGTAVLGQPALLLGWRRAGVALLVVAFALWIGLLPPVLRHRTGPAVGTSFLVTVSTEAVAALAAAVGGWGWLVAGALAMWLLGVGLYAAVLLRFDLRELVRGRGDQWVAGGALAISALAGADVALAAAAGPPWLHALPDGIAAGAAVLWVGAVAWVPALLVGELLPRRGGYDVRRWATVFPVGMLAACSDRVGDATHVGWMTSAGVAGTWVALAVWTLVAIGLVRRWPRLAPAVGVT